MQLLDLLVEHRNQLMESVNDYNKRLDRTVILYLTALYAVIGLRATNQIKLSDLSSDPELTLVAFLFIFLNFCIIIHGISQSAWTMCLAKYVHMNVNQDIAEVLKMNKKKIPKSFIEFDNWKNDIKDLAVKTRDFVIALWVLQVLAVSIYSLRLVDTRGFYALYPIQTYISAIILFVFLICVAYSGFLEIYLVGKYHEQSSNISIPKARIIILSFLFSAVVLLFCLFYVIK
jgi:hypothetical protein